MADINIDLDYFEHRKTKRTVGLLGRGADLLPIKLWRFCGKYHQDDGKLIGYSEQEIESACDWWGEKGKMVEAFLAVVWLEKIEGGFQVHDWLEHQGHLKAYKQRAKDASKARWSKLHHASSIAPSIPQAMLSPPLSIAKTRNVPLSTVEGECRGEDPAMVLYEAYPRKVGKQEALKVIRRLLKGGADHAVLLAKTVAYSSINREEGADPGYIPHPATWFNGGRYDDDPNEWRIEARRHGRLRGKPILNGERHPEDDLPNFTSVGAAI